MADLEIVSETRSFDGRQLVLRHASKETGTDMEFSLFLPPEAESGPVPVLFFLSGLTCTWENVTTKGGFQLHAARHGIALLAPDTSPRGTDLPGEHDDWDFGSGAGFYVDATQEPWSRHYRMRSYVEGELSELVFGAFPVDASRQAITGHSMGGHGALTMALRDPARWRSASAFAPIVAPCRVPWGEKALSRYLGDDRESWQAYDACELLATSTWRKPLLVDQGVADGFLEEQLRPELLREACERSGVPLELNLREGYDHSYYFIASFMGDHVDHHAEALSG